MILQENDLKIKYMYIQVKGKVKWRDVYSTKKPEYDRWIQFVDEFNSPYLSKLEGSVLNSLWLVLV